MKKWLKGVALVVGFLGVGMVEGSEVPRETVHKIAAGNSRGSGVVVRKGLMVSAWHVVEGVKIENVTVDVGKEWRKVEKVTRVGDSDLVLIRVDVDCPCAEMAEEGEWIGTEVVSIGYPFPSLLSGRLFVYHGEVVGRVMGDAYVASTAMAMPGMSGGGMFVKVGEGWKLLGVMYGILAVKGNGEGLQNWVSLMTVVPKGVL